MNIKNITISRRTRRKITTILSAVLLISVVLTFALTVIQFRNFNLGSLSNWLSKLRPLLWLNIAIIFIIGLLILDRLRKVIIDRKNNKSGSALQLRLTFLFTIISTLPTILITALAILYLNTAISSWFSSRISTAINESDEIAKSYLEEHQKLIGSDALSMVQELTSQLKYSRSFRGSISFAEPKRMVQIIQQDLRATLSIKSDERRLTEAMIINADSEAAIRSRQTLVFGNLNIADEHFKTADRGEIAIISEPGSTKVRALVRMPAEFNNVLISDQNYLLIGRPIDNEVLNKISITRKATEEYNTLEVQINDTQKTLLLIYILITCIFLFSSVLAALLLAKKITSPLVNLINAAEHVSEGDLSAKVDVHKSNDEVEMLGYTFNNMTRALQKQQDELMVVNGQLFERREFIEAILKAVSVCIISLDTNMKITMTNNATLKILNKNINELIGMSLSEVFPEMDNIINSQSGEQKVTKNSKIFINKKLRSIQYQLMPKYNENKQVTGYVLTFDDITELEEAQKSTAWAGVARRIAHEIKNPLTPIRLSAERLQRKYGNEVATKDTFDLCLSTIIRQVDQIKRLVNEFSDFARMPKANLQKENLSNILKGIYEIEKNRVDEVVINFNYPKDDIFIYCDAGLISQAVTNLLKNASEAALAKVDNKQPMITIELLEKDDNVIINVLDNGDGFADEYIDRALEPYVTSKTEGTGLGLAIVKKVMQDHNGFVNISNNMDGGAKVTISLPRNV